MSNYFDLAFHVDENWKLTVTAKDGNGTVIDLTGATVQFRVASASAALITAAVGSGITVSTPTSGIFVVDITSAAQDAGLVVPGAIYRYEARVVTAAGLKTIQLRGNIYVIVSLFNEFA